MLVQTCTYLLGTHSEMKTFESVHLLRDEWWTWAFYLTYERVNECRSVTKLDENMLVLFLRTPTL